MRVRDNKGSITLFVLVGLLFMSAFLLISYAYNMNKSKIAQEQFNLISGIYSPDKTDEESYTDAYTELRRKNKQTLTQSSENSNALELTKTFEENINNLKIYGNSVQEGTPDPDNPVEIQSVGEKTLNLSIENRTAGVLPDSSYAPTSEKAFEEDKFYRGIASSGYYISTYDEDATFIDGVYTLYGMDYGVGLPVKVEPNTTYTVSFGEKTGEARWAFYNEKGVYLDWSNKTTFTTPENCYWCVITLRPSEKATYSKIMLQTGSIATGYEPYGKYKIPIKVNGKNLLDTSKFIRGGITGAGVDFGSTSRMRTDFIQVEPNIDYTIIINSSFELSVWKHIHFYDENKVWISKTGTQNNFTTPANAKYIKIVIQKSNSSQSFTDEEVLNIQNSQSQLEKGKIATDYEKYYEPQTFDILLDEPLRKVGDIADYIDFSAGRVIRNIGKYTFNGSEFWVTTSDEIANNYKGFAVKSSTYNVRTGQNVKCLSNRFPYYENNSENICRIDSNSEYGMRIIASINIVPNFTSAEFKEWLNTNNTTMWYPLQTTIEKSIELPQFKTYEDYTNIQVLTDIAPSKIEATYQGYTLE